LFVNEFVGGKNIFFLGSEKNIKITTVEDIEIFKALLFQKMMYGLKVNG
jgi:2-C-methyl-D-erythritol 4-phosphate cytidylyltransferase